MAKWVGYFTTTASTSITVEADDEEGAEAALDKYIQEEGLPGLCASCSGWNRPGIDLADWGPAEFGPSIERVEE